MRALIVRPIVAYHLCISFLSRVKMLRCGDWGTAVVVSPASAADSSSKK